MEYIIYIGAALVIGLLIGFVALSVSWLRKTMLRNVRNHTLDLISVYDDLLAQKSMELAELDREIALRREEDSRQIREVSTDTTQQSISGVAPAVLLAATQRASEAAYRDKAVGDTYHQIRDNFSFRLNEVLSAASAGVSQTMGPAGRLLSEIEFETIYQLSTLPQERQLEVLYECLPQEGIALMEEYLQQHPQFAAFEFYDSLRSRAAEESKAVKVFVPGWAAAGIKARYGADVLVDDTICEGFQLEKGGKLYDYCIKTKELS